MCSGLKPSSSRGSCFSWLYELTRSNELDITTEAPLQSQFIWAISQVILTSSMHFPGKEYFLLYRFLLKMLMTQNFQSIKSASGLSSFCPEILPCSCEINDMNKREIDRIFSPRKNNSRRVYWLNSMNYKMWEWLIWPLMVGGLGMNSWFYLFPLLIKWKEERKGERGRGRERGGERGKEKEREKEKGAFCAQLL